MAEAHPFPGQAQLFFLGMEDGFRGLNLPGQPRLGDGRGGDVARQGQPCAFQLVALVVDVGGQSLQGAAGGAG